MADVNKKKERIDKRERKKDQESVLTALRELSSKRFKAGDLTFEGKRLIIPLNMSPKRAMAEIAAHIEQMDTVTQFSRTFNFRPWDGAAAFERAMMVMTGTAGIQKGETSFLSESHPRRINIKTGVNETMDVPWGTIEVGFIEGQVDLGSHQHPDLGILFHMTVDCPRRFEDEIDGLFNLVQLELEQNSIYRGKAFDGQTDPEFIDLRGVDPRKIIYSDDVEAQLDANIWSLLEYGDDMRLLGIPLKRAVLLHGDYGTGKTLAAFRTALKAVANGWTFIYCRPGKDNFLDVMQTARLYQPSVVVLEDMDTIADGGKVANGGEDVTKLLDVFDGITAKGTELMVVLTTNHPDRIHKGMVRPGRLDAVIEIGALDHGGVQRMIEAVVPSDMRAELDYLLIGNSMEGYMPAFVKEAIDRAMRYAISRTGGKPSTLTTEDFVLAGNGLRPQLEMMEGAQEGVHMADLDAAMGQRIEGIVNRTVLSAIDNGDFQLKVGGDEIQN